MSTVSPTSVGPCRSRPWSLTIGVRSRPRRRPSRGSCSLVVQPALHDLDAVEIAAVRDPSSPTTRKVGRLSGLGAAASSPPMGTPFAVADFCREAGLAASESDEVPSSVRNELRIRGASSSRRPPCASSRRRGPRACSRWPRRPCSRRRPAATPLL